MRVVIAIAVAAHVANAEPSFKPPAAVPAAQDRFVHAKTLFEAKQYADAASEFAAAYELDADAKFLLFNVALARRMAGECKDAIASYRAFLDAGPPEPLAKNARIGIERCEKALAAEPPPPPDVPPPVVDKPVDQPVAPPVVTHPPPLPVVEQPHTPWYRDGLGASLVGGGAVCMLGGATLYLLARHDADATFSPSSVTDYLDNRRSAERLQTASWIVAGVGGALAIAGTIRYVTHAPRRTLAVVPAARPGAVVVVEGRF